MTILEIILLSIIILFIIIGFFIIKNLLRKIEYSEDIVISYFEYLSMLSETIKESEIKLKSIDEKGIFKSDDEIGWFFDNIKTIQSLLNSFQVENLYGEKK